MNNEPIFDVPENMQTRWASPENWTGAKGSAAKLRGSRKGSACFTLRAGQSQVLAEVSGSSGTIRRIWTTINERDPEILRGLRIDIFWDGAKTPAVSSPWGDFFCQGLGEMIQFENALFSNPEGRSFNCIVPMPFRTGMKVVVTNESSRDVGMFFYDVNYTLGDKHSDRMCYLHAHWRRENPTALERDYEFLPKVKGCGRFLGVVVSMIADQSRYVKSWWGEGEFKVYLDGDTCYPTLAGTGTEDYIGTAWGQGLYANAYQGCHFVDAENVRYSFYRLHLPDPILFQQDIRVVMQQIGNGTPQHYKEMLALGTKELVRPGDGLTSLEALVAAGGCGLYEREDDWSSCAWFYLDRPENDLPSLQPVAERIAESFPAKVTTRVELTGEAAGDVADLRLVFKNEGKEAIQCAGHLVTRCARKNEELYRERLEVSVPPGGCERVFSAPVGLGRNQADWMPEGLTPTSRSCRTCHVEVPLHLKTVAGTTLSDAARELRKTPAYTVWSGDQQVGTLHLARDGAGRFLVCGKVNGAAAPADNPWNEPSIELCISPDAITPIRQWFLVLRKSGAPTSGGPTKDGTPTSGGPTESGAPPNVGPSLAKAAVGQSTFTALRNGAHQSVNGAEWLVAATDAGFDFALALPLSETGLDEAVKEFRCDLFLRSRPVGSETLLCGSFCGSGWLPSRFVRVIV